jgi:hypothetical protein
MPYTHAARNLMLNALKGTNPTTPITHCSLLTAAAAITGVTGVAATDLLTKSGHGLSNGNLVVLASLSGGTGLVVTRPYYVVGVSGNDFQLSHTSGGSAVDFTSDITSVSVIKLTEVSGGSPAYARQAIAFAAASEGTIDDSTNGAVFDVPAAGQVDYVGFHSASTAGTLLGVDDVTSESFAGQGTYTVTDAKLDLLATA